MSSKRVTAESTSWWDTQLGWIDCWCKLSCSKEEEQCCSPQIVCSTKMQSIPSLLYLGKYTSMCINLRSVYFHSFVLFGSNQPKFIDILYYWIYKIRVNSPLSLSKSTKILVWSRTYKIQGLLFFDYPQSLLSNIGL